MIGRALIGAGLALVLGAANLVIAQKESILRGGERVLLELAPVDPRSLMQGDYMRLDYAIAREIRRADGWQISSTLLRWLGEPEDASEGWPEDGRIVVRRVAKTSPDGAVIEGVAEYVAPDAGAPIQPGQVYLRYRRRGGTLRVGTDAFYFQEGTADTYDRAKYGELRVDAAGDSVLVGLCDEAGRPLGPGLR